MRREMRSKFVLLAMFSLALVAFAKDPKPMERGTLVQMETVTCAASSKQTQNGLCQEYLLQAGRVTYRIRPRATKHAALLPVGEAVQFRLDKDGMLLQAADLDDTERSGKGRAFIVVSIAPRTESTAADSTPIRLNHLQ